MVDMGMYRKIQSGLNIFQQARDLGLPVWKTPTVLFGLMALLTVILMITVHFVVQHNDDPRVLVVAEAIVVMTVFSIGGSMISAFEEIARSNKMKSEFITIVSHQMKTPLTKMKWLMSQWERSEDYSPRRMHVFLNQMRLANETIIHLSSDLMDAARIDRGEKIVILGKVALKDLVIIVMKEYEMTAGLRNIRMCFQSDPGDAMVLGDDKRVKVVVDNLLSNAVKYSRDGGRIFVGISDSGDSRILSVKDDGVGIPEDQKQFVFEKFFRGRNVASGNVDGTGLGLFLSRGIIHQIGGTIEFRSTENVGSEFLVSFPAIKDTSV